MEMEIHVILLIFSHLTAYSYGQGCPTPSGFKCNPLNGTCVTMTRNGTGLNWFDMQSSCEQDDGRLVWLNHDFNALKLATTMNSLNSIKSYEILVTGLLTLADTPSSELLFSAHPNSSVCGSGLTDICSSDVTSEAGCSALGCCWNNFMCRFPEHQSVTTYNISRTIEGLTKTTERQCIGLEIINGNSVRNWTTFNCSEPYPGNVGFVCEFRCNGSWPNTTENSKSWSTLATTIPVTQNSIVTSTNAATTLDNTNVTSTIATTTLDNTNVASDIAATTLDNTNVTSTIAATTNDSATLDPAKPKNPALSTSTVDPLDNNGRTHFLCKGCVLCVLGVLLFSAVYY